MVLTVLGLATMLFTANIPVVEYDPAVAEIIQSVSEDSLITTISRLSGEVPVIIAGEPDSLPCRYAYSPGCGRAALWLAEQLENRGVSVELQPIIPVSFRDVDILQNGKGWSCRSPFSDLQGPYLYKTTDGGRSWQCVDTDSFSVEKLVAISDNALWGVSAGRIIATSDGGQNWQVEYDRDSIKEVTAIDDQHGWAVGRGSQDDAGLVVSTTDGWETWVERTPFLGFPDIVEFVSLTHGWVASTANDYRYNNLWRTQDGGLSWDTLASPLEVIRAMSFVDSTTGFLVGYFPGPGAVYKTSDGGINWEVSIDSLPGQPSGICTIGPDTVYVVGGDGFILFSPDCGTTWQEKESGTIVHLNVVDGSAGTVSVLGYTRALYSEDGDNWQQAQVETPDTSWNVVGTYQGETDKKVLIIAHYDAISEDPMNYTPGADDNASGVSAVLESARLLSGYDWQNTLKFILFTGEETGLWGSMSYASDNRDSGCMVFLNADMIAYDGNDDGLLEVHGYPGINPASAGGMDVFSEVVDIYDLDLTLKVVDESQIGDGWSLCFAGMPGLSIIENYKGSDDFNPFYHTTEETLDKLNTPYLTEGTKACVGWMATMANMDSLGQVREEVITLKEMVTLRLSSAIMRSQGWVEISSPYPVTPQIYDAVGRKVKTLASVPASTEAVRIPLEVSDLPRGVYWVAASGKESVVSERFVLVR